MTYFEQAHHYVKTENLNLINFLQLKSPTTPAQEDFRVGMEEIDVDLLKDCIIYNLLRQELCLKSETCLDLIKFLEDDFSDLTKKTFLQVLVHFTKIEAQQFYEKYSSDFDRFPSGKKLTCSEYFDSQIAAYVERAQIKSSSRNEIVYLAPEQTKETLLTALLSSPVLSAYQYCFTSMLNRTQELGWLESKIHDMNIYLVNDFIPLKGLRGACLVDGILICVNKLGGAADTIKREADLITVSVHECGHYLVRANFGDFNFSSPFSSRFERTEPRCDLVFPQLKMEVGRSVELLLFDMVQPSWWFSSEKAAIQFVERLKCYKKYPVLEKREHQSLGLSVRSVPSQSFGIDIEEYDDLC